ncbi:MAG TPA: diaminopimelate epimerase [Acidiferrobacteraceae bacterium]|nr:diaminopimelate epimerase [Acidiferrobacteraceae bacterium]
MMLKFSKMQALGNDFVVIDVVRQRVRLERDQIRHLADRYFGVGCDQLLLVEPASQVGVDFNYRIFNADGGEVDQCGNGARCFAKFVRHQGLTDKHEIMVSTGVGVIQAKVEQDGRVHLDMGSPRFEPTDIPFVADGRQDRYDLDVDGDIVDMTILSMGNPHAVQIVDAIDQAPVAIQGPLIERHSRFPQRVNAGYMEIVSDTQIRLRVYERGVGETLACGSGACAAVVAGRIRGLLKEQVQVQLRGGQLDIYWAGEGHSVEMTGPANHVFDGQIDVDTL